MRIKGGWKNKLTKKDLKHLKEDANVTTLNAFIRTHKFHELWRKKAEKNNNLYDKEPCYHCRSIARKLGLLIEKERSQNEK